MDKSSLLLLAFFALFFTVGEMELKTSVIPIPNRVETKEGQFTFSCCTHIQYNKTNTKRFDPISPLIAKLNKAASINLLSSVKCKSQSVADDGQTL
jgi:hypothetical protein